MRAQYLADAAGEKLIANEVIAELVDIHTGRVYPAEGAAASILMSRRVNIMLPDATIKVLDRVAPKGGRSRFISQAVLHYVQTQSKAKLRERLKQAALANARLDLEMAAEWFPVEQEACERLEKEEQLRKPIRGVGRSTSRRSTRR